MVNCHTIQYHGNLLAVLFSQNVIHQGGFTGSKVPLLSPLISFRQWGLDDLPVTMVMGTLSGFDSSRLSLLEGPTSTNKGGESSSSTSILYVLKMRSKCLEKLCFLWKLSGKSQPCVPLLILAREADRGARARSFTTKFGSNITASSTEHSSQLPNLTQS